MSLLPARFVVTFTMPPAAEDSYCVPVPERPLFGPETTSAFSTTYRGALNCVNIPGTPLTYMLVPFARNPRCWKSLCRTLPVARIDGEMLSTLSSGCVGSLNASIVWLVIFVVVNGTSIVSFDPRKPTEPRRVTNVPFPS